MVVDAGWSSDVGDEAIDVVPLFVVVVVSEFEGDVLQGEEANGYAGDEAEDIDGGEDLVGAEVAEGRCEVVGKHG